MQATPERPSAAGTRGPGVHVRTARPISELPKPWAWPLVGNLPQLDPRRTHLVLERWARQLGPRYRIALGSRNVLVTGNLASIQEMLTERPTGFRRIAPLEEVFREVGVDGLFSAEGDAWRKQRRLVNPAFGHRHLRDVFPVLVRKTERLHSRWLRHCGQPGGIDVRADLMRYAIDVSCTAVLGHGTDTLGGDTPELQRHLTTIFEAVSRRLVSPYPYWRYFKLPRDRATDRSVTFVRRHIAEVVAQARREQAAGDLTATPRTLLHAMLAEQEHEGDGQALDDELIAGNVMTLFLAGEDTTANTIAWMLWYMATDREVLGRCREEAARWLGDRSTVQRYEDVSKLKFARAVAMEALRMRSVAPLLYLEALEDTVVDGVVIPRGGWIFALSRVCGVDPQNFSEPDRFDPSRWLNTSPAYNHTPNGMLAFGGGPRTCPGRALALTEAAMVASMVAHRFDLALVDEAARVEEQFAVTMYPSGLRLAFRERTSTPRDTACQKVAENVTA